MFEYISETCFEVKKSGVTIKYLVETTLFASVVKFLVYSVWGTHNEVPSLGSPSRFVSTPDFPTSPIDNIQSTPFRLTVGTIY
jgi:hypothetical protein